MISREEVLNLAELARLNLSEEEIAHLQKDISSILDYVGQVSAVGVESVKELKPVLRNIMREDKSTAEGVMVLGKRDALIEAFPNKEKAAQGGWFNAVRKIISKDE